MRVRVPRTLTIALSLLALLLAGSLFFGSGPASATPTDALISAPDGSLFLLIDGKRHPVDSATLAALGVDETATRVVSQRLFTTYTESTPIPQFQNGALIADASGATYFVLDGLHQVPSEATFSADGWGGYQKFGETPVAVVDAALLAALPKGAPLEEARRGNAGLFEWGNCTWWVAQRRAVTWLGNGGEWYANAKAQGYAVGDQPLPGAILVRQSASPGGYGHVAYVESVDGNSFTVSEMNVSGVGQLTTRTYNTVSDPPPGLIGYVYWRFGAEPAPVAVRDALPDRAAPQTGPPEKP
jgi:hypothetical protein